MRLTALFLSLFFIVCSCEVKVGTGSDGNEQSSTPVKEEERKSNKIRNGIRLNENGLKVEEAYLKYEDGSVVSNENKIDVGQKVILQLKTTGWKAENNKVFPGASEKISNSEGGTFLDKKDLFEIYADGVSPEDVKSITLSAVITKTDKIYDYFLVEFRVWDKKSNHDISGSYKLYLK